MKPLDDLLNKMTMYRLVVYVLGILAALSIIFAKLGHLAASPTQMIISLGLILCSAWVTNRGFSYLFQVPTNMESWLITSLILYLILQPANSVAAGLALVLAGAISSASKFLLARKGKHFFNPAALAAAFLSLWGFWPTTWWIGSSIFWPFSLVLGLVVIRKVRRFSLFATFAVISVVLQAALFIHHHQPLFTNMKHALIASPLIFLSTIMLTEPATMPPRRNMQLVFASLVAVLYVAGWKVGPVIIYPEVALLVGNLFAYAVSPKARLRLKLQAIQRVSDRVYAYTFKPDGAFQFLPGQYMEWTLAGVPYDSRGNRRSFTIASSPTESEVHVGLKYYEPSSTYKSTFHDLEPGDVIYGSQLAGNFTLNGNETKKLAFIAGGIGITPFRSMIKYITDKGTACDIVLLYLVSDPDEFAYVEDLKAAANLGVKTIPIVTKTGEHQPGLIHAHLSPRLLSKVVPDYDERLFYVSGPNHMVDNAKQYLRELGVANNDIKTDHFSGY